MTFERALPIARRVFDTLRPHCERIEVAGSIRRRRAEVKDIEIVATPKQDIISTDLYGAETKIFRSQDFVNAVLSIGERVKGDPDEGRYFTRLLKEGIKVDIFTATKENWGFIFAIRTGSAVYSKKVLGDGWVRAGYKGVEGMLTRHGMPVPVYEEEDLFKLAHVDFVMPWYREVRS